MFVPLNWIGYTQQHTILTKYGMKPLETGPSECCGAVFVIPAHEPVWNKGITIWFSDKDESQEHNDFFTESVKLVNGTYMHFKHNLREELPEPKGNEEDEGDREW